MKAKPPVTIALPESYVAGDLDGDGQIAFYEWKQWKRGDLAGFQALDHNQDGFLEPAELVKGPSSTMLATAAVIPGGGATVMQTQPVSVTTPAGNSDELRTVAEARFKLMDQNGDGSLSPEEWSKSTKMKPKFEAAGIDLGSPMPKEAFVAHFVRVESSN